MNSKRLFYVCVVLSITKHSIAKTDDKKYTKMDGRSDTQKTTLRKQLLCDYDRYTAPVNASYDSHRVQVEISLGRYRIDYRSSPGSGGFDQYNLFEKTPNWLTMSAYIIMSWQDQRLRWNKSEHNNQTKVHFSRSEIWAPRTPLMRKSFEADYQMSCSASWSVVKAERVFPLKDGKQNEQFLKIHKQISAKYGPDYFETKVVIQKNFAIQDAVIFAPAAVLFILLTSSTWIPAKQEARIALLSMTIIVEVFMFHQASRTMPFFAGKLVNIVDLYQDLIICSGAAVLHWLIVYLISSKKKSTSNIVPIASQGPSVLSTICCTSAKDPRGITILIDRIFFILLAITSFTLVVFLSGRPPSLPFSRGFGHVE